MSTAHDKFRERKSAECPGQNHCKAGQRKDHESLWFGLQQIVWLDQSQITALEHMTTLETGGRIHKLVTDFLRNRMFRFRMGYGSSNSMQVTSGMPQRSGLTWIRKSGVFLSASDSHFLTGSSGVSRAKENGRFTVVVIEKTNDSKFQLDWAVQNGRPQG